MDQSSNRVIALQNGIDVLSETESIKEGNIRTTPWERDIAIEFDCQFRVNLVRSDFSSSMKGAFPVSCAYDFFLTLHNCGSDPS